MLEFLLLTIVSALISWILIWIDLSRFTLIPGFFWLAYIIGFFSGISISSDIHTTIFKKYGSIISRCIVLIGIMVLLNQQGIVRYHITTAMIIINIALLYASYQRFYDEGKILFVSGILVVLVMSIIYALGTRQYDSILTLMSLSSITLLGIFYNISSFFTLNQQDTLILSHQQELALYSCIFVIFYRLFAPNRPAVVVVQLWFLSAIIAIRQTYLRTKQHISEEKKSTLTGRAILAGQKVMDRYDQRSQKNFSLDIFSYLIQHKYMPSARAMPILQYLQLIGMLLLLIISIIGIISNTDYTLIRYWFGIICFIITLFGISSEEQMIRYYKPITLALITGAYYITLFDITHSHSTFVWGSVAWLSLNMIGALFYSDIFPQSKHLLTRKDIVFRLSMIIIGSIITILSLIRLTLSGDIIFALSCIIIGLVSFFSYHIWRK